MKKSLFLLVLFSLLLGVAAPGYCAEPVEPVSMKKGDFTIDGITVGDNIKAVIAKKGRPSQQHKMAGGNAMVYQYSGRYMLMAKADGTVWYIATNTLPSARNVKAGMSKQEMIAAYGDQFRHEAATDRDNYEYLDEATKTKIVFVFFSKGDKVTQVDCKKYG